MTSVHVTPILVLQRTQDRELQYAVVDKRVAGLSVGKGLRYSESIRIGRLWTRIS